MKKIISLLMALIFVFSMAAPSFAAVAANEAVVLQASDVNGGDEASGSDDFLGKAVDILNQIWSKIVNFFKSLFGLGFKPGTYNVTYYTDATKSEVLYVKPTQEGSELEVVAVPTKIGYTFKAWEPALPSVMPNEDIEVYATWSIKTVTIKFDADKPGVKVNDISTTYGKEVVLPEVPDVDKEVLIGWKDTLANKVYAPGTKYKAVENVTFIAVWGVKGTTITFAPDGGSWDVKPYDKGEYAANGNFLITAPVGTAVPVIADPTRAGYKFEGWDGVIPANQPSEDRTYTAVWSPLSITTKWMLKDGTLLNTQTTKCGENLSPKVSPVPEAGYKFAGWKSDVDGVVYSSFPIETPSVDTTFTAEFEAIEYAYAFKGENGAIILSGKALCGDTVGVPNAPVKEGYTFNGWADANGTVKISADATTFVMQAGDAVYTATYVPNAHTITWNAAGGKVNGKDSDVTNVAYGSEITAPSNITKQGYDFVNWTPSVPATMPDEDLVFTAVWTEAGDTPYTVETYTMGTNGEYSKTSAEKTGVTGAEITISPEGKEGFTVNSSESVLTGTIAANGSLVLKVYYDRNKYNVTINGETKQYYFGETIKAPAAAEKEGNTFKGWRGSDDKLYDAGADVTVPAIDNFEFVAEYEVINYKVTFYTYSANSTEYTVWHSADVAYDSEIVAPAAPSIPNMYFEGWSQNKESTSAEVLLAKMPAHNLTYYAVFSENVDSYSVTFDANGGKFPDKTTKTVREVFRGQPINLPKDAPSKSNLRFLGWAYDKDAKEAVEIGVLTEAKDITIYAVYAPITCEVKFNYKDIDGTVKSHIFNAGTDAATDTVVYTISTDGGSVEVTVPDMKEIKGYQFSGWSLEKVNGEIVERNEDGTLKDTKISEFTVKKADYTREYYAEYIVNKHNVTFVGDAKCNWSPEEEGAEAVLTETKSVDFGEMIVAPEAPDYIEDGFAFIGWVSGDEAVLFDETLTIYTPGSDIAKVGDEEGYSDSSEYTFAAVYDFHKFIIKYNYDGETLHTEELMFGEEIIGFTPEENQILKGMKFTGWTPEVPETVDVEMFKTAVWDEELDAYVYDFTAATEAIVYKINFFNCFKDSVEVPFNSEIDAELANAAPEAETGYTFKGWLDENGEEYMFPEYMPANDINVYADWEINSHSVTWIVDGKETVIEYNYEESIEIPEDPTKEGYSFVGWDADVPATMPDEDLVFTAEFEINSYTVTWNLDGLITDEETYNYGDVIKVPDVPSKTGYTFIGWEDYTTGMTMPATDLELTAQWLIKTYTVTWIVDETETVEVYNYSADIVKPADPTKEGYEFTGWTPDVAGTIGEENLTYTATFEKCVYDVTFLSGEDYGNVSEIVGVPFDEVIYDYAPEAFDNATNTEGQYITGWDGLEDGTKMPVPAEDEKFEYTAIWGTESYNFKFVYGEAEEDVIIINAEFGATDLSVDAPEKAGYEFKGWIDSEGNEITLPMTVEKDYGENGATVEFTADWEALPYEATFVANGGNFGEETDDEGETYLKTTETIEVPCGSEIEFPENPVRKGYTFLGWNGSDGSFVAAEDISSSEVLMPVDGIEYLANWEVKTFKITYDYDGGKDSDGNESKAVSIPYGSVIPVPEVSREGYTFSKWDSVLLKDQTLDVESDLEFKATWIADDDTVYTVKVYVMDTEGNYGEPTEITKSGTTDEIGLAEENVDFSLDKSYQEIDTAKSTNHLSTTITGDNKALIEVYIARKQFAVYTEIDGEKVKVDDYYYGSVVSEPAKPDEKEGYSFAWEGYTEGMTMPAEDVVIKGVWTVKTYTVTVGNAGKDKVYEFAYGEGIVIPEPTRDGYTFAGWDKELPATMPANNITVNANWTKNS